MTAGVSADLEWTWELQLRQGQIDANNKIVCKYSPDGVMTETISTVAGQASGKKYITADFNGLPMPLLEIDTSSGQVVRTNIFDTTGQILLQHDGDYNDDRYFYLNDRLGSVRMVIDDEGTTKEQFTYSPFGEPLVEDHAVIAPANDFRFAKYRWESILGQYYLNARWYDPALYRLIGRDPVYGDFNEPLTLHAYLYCLNNPLNSTDPTGEWSLNELTVTQSIQYGLRAYGGINMANRVMDYADMVMQGIGWQQMFMTIAIDSAIDYAGGKVFGYALKGLGKVGGKMMKLATGGVKAAEEALEKHHLIPRFLGGLANGRILKLPKSLHTGSGNSLHNILRKHLKKAFGDEFPSNLSTAEFERLLKDSKRGGLNYMKAAQALVDSASEFDSIHPGYNVTEEVVKVLGEQWY